MVMLLRCLILALCSVVGALQAMHQNKNRVKADIDINNIVTLPRKRKISAFKDYECINNSGQVSIKKKDFDISLKSNLRSFNALIKAVNSEYQDDCIEISIPFFLSQCRVHIAHKEFEKAIKQCNAVLINSCSDKTYFDVTCILCHVYMEYSKQAAIQEKLLLLSKVQTLCTDVLMRHAHTSQRQSVIKGVLGYIYMQRGIYAAQDQQAALLTQAREYYQSAVDIDSGNTCAHDQLADIAAFLLDTMRYTDEK